MQKYVIDKSDNFNKMKFTISVSPSLSRANLELLTSDFIINLIKKYSDKINDINFTCHIPPFLHDAHGVYLSELENEIHLKQMIKLQEKTSVMITPVFNNIFVSNSYNNLELFIKNFKRLYEMGIRNISIPHLLWLKMGLLKKTFPDLSFKNTVLRRVRNGQEFWNYAEAGFDYINLDRIIVRDLKSLKDIYFAQQKFKEKTGKHVYTSILTGEGCFGICPLWEEHYQHTLTNPDIDENLEKNLCIFRYPQSFSCLAFTDPSCIDLISVGLPSFREDLNELCRYFDIIKLGGRRAFQSISDNLKIIESFISSKEEIIFHPPEVIQYLYSNRNIYGDLLNKWRITIKNCCFQCWRCNLCSELIAQFISNKIKN